MAIEKYRVHEVAKDFGLPTKVITEILSKYATAPKNHMQVLDDRELSIIFDYLTQHNPVSGIQVIFADTYQEKKEEAPKQQAQQPAVPRQVQPIGDLRPRPTGPDNLTGRQQILIVLYQSLQDHRNTSFPATSITPLRMMARKNIGVIFFGSE